MQFQTKAEIALDLLDQARDCGLPHSLVVADADYGDNPLFLNGLEERKERYCVAIRANFSVVLSGNRDEQIKRAEEVLSDIASWQWQTLSWKEGSQGRLRAKFVALRCWRVDGAGSRQIGWLIGVSGPDAIKAVSENTS